VASGIVMESDTLSPNLKTFPPKVESAIDAAFYVHSLRTEGWMRDNAPWQDQTGNARNGLRARPDVGGATKVIWVYHTVPYGIWLEVRWDGRFAIIGPTVRVQGRALMTYLRNLFGRVL